MNLDTELSSQLAEDAANQIIEAFEKKANVKNLEVDFEISSGKMVDKNKKEIKSFTSPNTWFKFDITTEESLSKIQYITEKLYSEDFDIKDKESMAKAEAEDEKFTLFRQVIVSKLNEERFHTRLANVIRKICFNNFPPQLMPINTINFLEIEFNTKDDNRFLLVIQKMARVDRVTGEFMDSRESIQEDLISEHNKSGLDFNDIIAKRKAEKDPRYEMVAGVEKRQYIFDVQCEISADYSFCDREKLIHGSHPNPESLKLVQCPNQALFTKASPVIDFNEYTKLCAERMITILKSFDSGIGLAANQVGLLYRIFVCQNNLNEPSIKEKSHSIYINPEIIEKSSNRISGDEGCLSFPGIRGSVSRHQEITIRYQNIDGSISSKTVKDLEARCFQHEIDHLDGINIPQVFGKKDFNKNRITLNKLKFPFQLPRPILTQANH